MSFPGRWVTADQAVHLLETALQANGLLLAHNHPSGNCRPSAQDIRSTRLLRDLGQMLD